MKASPIFVTGLIYRASQNSRLAEAVVTAALRIAGFLAEDHVIEEFDVHGLGGVA